MFQEDFFGLHDPRKTTRYIGYISDMLDDGKSDIPDIREKTVFSLGGLLEYS